MNSNFRSQIEQRKNNIPANTSTNLKERNIPFNFNEIEKELREESREGEYTKPSGSQKPNFYENKKDSRFQNNRNPTSQIPRRNENTISIKKEEDSRTGMSSTAWAWVFNATELILDVIKGIMIVGGIIASNLADFIMGSIGISLIVNTKITSLTFVNGFGFGSILSMGASAIQIYMWSLIQKRGITAKMLLNPKLWGKIPSDVRGFLGTAMFLWLIDTLLDVSPTFVLFTPENFTGMMWLYYLLVGSVLIIVTILCGFAEILTSNMRAMLAGAK